MLSGCIPVISDRTPWNDLDLYNCGYAIPLDNPGDFTRAIERLCSADEETISCMSSNVVEYIRDKLDISAMVDKYTDTLSKVCGS